MKLTTLTLIFGILFFSVAATAFAQEMSKDEWQRQMNENTFKRNDLKTRLDRLNSDITSMKNQSSKLDADLAACEDELYKLLGVTREEVEAFDRELARYEKRADELMKLSDADLLKYRDEVMQMSKRVEEMAKSKIASLPRFANRLSALKSKIQSLMNTIEKAGMANVYTVGTWARDRDCLWNIAKKPTIYSNAWLWPKIWQGNKDKIKDPDIIRPGWKLNIPAGKELTQAEKSAANLYYRKKAGK